MKLFKIYLEEKKGKFSTNEQMNLDYISLNVLIAKCLISSIFTKKSKNIIIQIQVHI